MLFFILFFNLFDLIWVSMCVMWIINILKKKNPEWALNFIMVYYHITIMRLFAEKNNLTANKKQNHFCIAHRKYYSCHDNTKKTRAHWIQKQSNNKNYIYLYFLICIEYLISDKRALLYIYKKKLKTTVSFEFFP